MKPLAISVLILLSGTALAQKDYLQGFIVLNRGDTIRGLVKDRRSTMIKIYNKVRLKLENGRNSKWSSRQIISYYRGAELFVSRHYQGQQVFLKLIESGPVNYFQHLSVDDDSYLFEKKLLQKEGSSEYLQVIGIGFRKRLINYFSDCLDLVDKIHLKEFRYRNLQDAVKYYNEHCQQNAIE